MNSAPITSWEGAAAYFTFADNPAMIAVFCGLAVAGFIGFMAAIIKHEKDAFDKHED